MQSLSADKMKTVVMSESIAEITRLIMVICEGNGTEKNVRKLREISINHTPDCALGAVPSCTCGKKEAANFIALFEGTIQGSELVMK